MTKFVQKNLPKIFPILDHLYLFQLLEYNFEEFFKWFLKNPFKRNLQRKKKLTFSAKIIALLPLTIFWQIVAALIFYSLTKSILFFLLSFLLLQSFSPFFIILANLSIGPLEDYFQNKILESARNKLSSLPNCKVVAITGSFGKTSTKDILYTLLWKKFYVVKTPKSFNTPLGIAQTILELLKENTQFFICEIGTYKAGEISLIADLIKPEIGIITAIAAQHLEKFGSLEKIAKAKFELIENLQKNGLAILNGNYKMLEDLSFHPMSFHPKGVRTIFYGRQKDFCYATNINSGLTGTSFTLHTPKGKTTINIPLTGGHHVQNFLAAAACAFNLGLTLSEIKQRAKLLLPTPHRMEIKKIGNTILIDNSYNTNPKSAESSLKLLASFKNARKIIITPGFVELGKEAAEANRQFGQDLVSTADEIIIVGENARKDLLDGIEKVWPDHKGNVHFTPSTREALKLSQQIAETQETVVLLENDLPDQYF